MKFARRRTSDLLRNIVFHHSPRIPSKEEMVQLLQRAKAIIPEDQLWVNPDCELKTRHWDDTQKALKAMVEAVPL